MQYAKSQLLLSEPKSLHFFTSNPWQEAENLKHSGKNSKPKWVHKGEKWSKSIWFRMWCLSWGVSISLGTARGVSEGLPFSNIPGNGLYLDISYSTSILSQHFHSGQLEGTLLLSSELQPVLLFGKLLLEQWFLGHPSRFLSRITCEFRLFLAAHRRFAVPLLPLTWGN